MKVQDLSGRLHPLVTKGYEVMPSDTRPRSSLHLRCRALLRKLYPLDTILEEIPVPGEQLFLDFFIPSRKLILETQGEQHYEYNHFFHGSAEGFKRSKANDARKQEWAQINNFKLVELPYNESDREWAERILGKRGTGARQTNQELPGTTEIDGNDEL